ncbi:MAG TPA: hypothetical protein VNR18_09075 [Hyphomicrobiales bacterium]|nr:hypothetical protein [Hyphomicrobiales bacterium]
MWVFRLSLVSLALAATGALAQTALEFSKVDRNGDGVLSLAEFQSALPTLVVSDTNGDGMLSQSEVERALPTLNFSANGFQGGEAFIGRGEFALLLNALHLNE